jgi:hypothetical protein
VKGPIFLPTASRFKAMQTIPRAVKTL